MNENHKRRIATTFLHMDGLLRAALAALAGDQSDPPFGTIALDTSHAQFLEFQSRVRKLRGLMECALADLDIDLPGPSVPASRSALTDLVGAEIDLQELNARTLRGYGPMDPDKARALVKARTDLLEALAEARALLSKVGIRSPDA